jgi:hypothetical protein
MQSHSIRVLVVSVGFQPSQFAHRATHMYPSTSSCNLWVQCETLELRFLKCSIKWDVLTFCFSPVSASLLHSFYSLENTALSLAYFFLFLGNNDRAICISRCKRNRTHKSSFNLEQKWSQSDKGAVNGRLLSAEKAHIWIFPQLPPSGVSWDFSTQKMDTLLGHLAFFIRDVLTRLDLVKLWLGDGTPLTIKCRVGQNCIYTPYMTIFLVIIDDNFGDFSAKNADCTPYI